ncbi:PE-PPE domain-containing protein [Mycobacterium sp. GA-2829]|uniref:PE-PPE domain-containing protein n=1 Tax=Mycobacterium sp. GA-2829 TaxID=1772283 RepID=UPI00073FAAB0|nr:PE-PPE domain-containing protein [Mycobacterium sp. GA-2829]KUI25484.1 hypothetical protein AU194_00875 [Mycobacterium sp. GA-2829]
MAVAVPAAALGLAIGSIGPLPTLPTPTELLAQGLYLRGTKIGGYTDFDEPFVQFANGVLDRTYNADNPDDTVTLEVDVDQIEYNGGFRPISHGGFDDLTYGQSVEQGVGRLSTRVASERAAGETDPVLVYGYSQGAVVAGQYKARTTDGDIVYVLLSNPGRPNGGILARFQGFTIPILDIPLSGPTPTTSEGWQPGDALTTYDLVRQYDGWADFPKYPLNLLATINALLGIAYLHGTYELDIDPEEALADEAETDTHVYRDTVYYTMGTDLLPLLRPLEQIGIPRPLLLALDAPLRVIVEQGYDRGSNFGSPSPAGLIRLSNPVDDLVNLLTAVAVGVDDGLQAGGFGRPLNTKPAGMYGVGGPAVTPPGDVDTDGDDDDEAQSVTAEDDQADDEDVASVARQSRKSVTPTPTTDAGDPDGDDVLETTPADDPDLEGGEEDDGEEPADDSDTQKEDADTEDTEKEDTDTGDTDADDPAPAASA